METGGIRAAGYMTPYGTGNRKKGIYGKTGGFEAEERGGDRKPCTDTIAQASVMDIFDRLKKGGRNIPSGDASAGEPRPEEGRNQTAGQETESETETQVIVRPDGSRALLMTMSVGGMKTTMSLELSKPTDMQNDYRQENPDGSIQQNTGAASPAEAAGEGAEE